MAMRRRTRMISFRVSEPEFQALQARSEAEGARSISDFARLALCNASREHEERIVPDLSALHTHIQQLSDRVQRVTDLLERSGNGSSAPSQEDEDVRTVLRP